MKAKSGRERKQAWGRSSWNLVNAAFSQTTKPVDHVSCKPGGIPAETTGSFPLAEWRVPSVVGHSSLARPLTSPCQTADLSQKPSSR